MVRRILCGTPAASGDVAILLTNDAEMRALNRRFLGLDRPTDVLSFPAEEEASGHLGDIAISVEAAARQACDAGWGTAEEVEFLVLHGMLHLLGFDHETDSGQMEREQARWARRFWGRRVPESRRGPALGRSRGARRKVE